MVKNLKRLRNGVGISQQQLADVIGVSQQSVNKYENHSIEPDIETLIKTADYFGVSVDYLIGRIDDKNIEMNCVTGEELALITKYRALSPRARESILLVIKNYLGEK